MKFCPYCGANNPDDYNYCNQCQKMIPAEEDVSAPEAQQRPQGHSQTPPPPVQPPQTSYPPAPKPSKSKVVIAVIVVIIIIIAALSVVLISLRDSSMAPDEVMRNFYEKANDEDIGCLDYTIIKFAGPSEYNEFASGMEDTLAENIIITINRLNVYYEENITTERINNMENMVDELNDELNIHVIIEEYCIIDITITQIELDESDIHSWLWICVKIDGEWYLSFSMVEDWSEFDDSSTPVGAWNSVVPQSQTEGKLTFGAFTEDVAPTDIRIYVNGGAGGYISIPDDSGSAPQTCIWTGGPAGATATYFDYNPAGGEINSGDYIELDGLQPGTAYTFDLHHIPTDATIAMTGASPQFVTPSS